VDDAGGWIGPDHPKKTLWVVLRMSEAVRITGRRLDAPGFLTLRRGGDAPGVEFVVSNPARQTVIPAGASAAIMQTYAFLPSHVFYPSPGCWEFTVRTAEKEVRIIRELARREGP
jgi:hypothetical protein